jgi:hypothetical protein
VNVAHARDLLDEVLGQPLVRPLAHGAEQRDLGVTHANLDVTGVEVARLAHALAHVFPDPLVGALVAARPACGPRIARRVRSVSYS